MMHILYNNIIYLYVNKFVVFGYSKRYGKFTREHSFNNFLLVVSRASEGEFTTGQRPAT